MIRPACLLLLAAAAAAHDIFLPTSSQEANITAQGIDAYIYFYPLVLMDATAPPKLFRNRLWSKKAFVKPGPQSVVTPNVDTLYTTGFLQLAGNNAEVLDMPDAHGRYYVMQYIDAWTNTFASPGKRLTGTAPQSFALVGPDFDGTPPGGATLIRSPTNLVWLLGRIQTNNTDDVPAVNAFQKQIKLRKVRGDDAPEQELALDATPPQAVAAMDAKTFFGKAAQLMKSSMPPADDADMVANQLAGIGIVPGQDFEWSALPATTQSQLESVPAAALQAIAHYNDNRPLVNGWTQPNPKTGGPYGTDYQLRAFVAMVGLGANQAAEAVYLSGNQDAAGASFCGDEVYKMRFAAGQTPPVKAFWSLTLYDKDHYLVPNPANKYSIGDRDELIYEEDGSLVLTVSATEPTGPANWLPAPAGAPFSLTARAYWPVGGLLDGSWQMPGMERQSGDWRAVVRDAFSFIAV